MPLIMSGTCVLLYVVLQADFAYHVFFTVIQRFAKLTVVDFSAYCIA